MQYMNIIRSKFLYLNFNRILNFFPTELEINLYCLGVGDFLNYGWSEISDISVRHWCLFIKNICE